jgi:hypothetical protein
MDRLTDLVAAAADAGYALVPVGRDSKVSLTRWNRRDFPRGELLYHVAHGGNLAAKVGETRDGVRTLVVDRDARTRETWDFLRGHGLHRSNMQTETASGNWHLWFRLPDGAGDIRTKIKLLVEGRKLPVDVKASGYVLLPGSTIGGRAYRWREGRGLKRPGELVPVPDSLLALLDAGRGRPVPRVTGRARAAVRNILHPGRYALTIESIQGRNGSAGLVRAVCVLRDCGWDPGRILAFLVGEWNRPPRVVPPWSPEEIARAVNRHCGGRPCSGCSG